MKRVWIAILNQGWVRPELCNLMLKLATQEKRYLLNIHYPNHTPIVNNRNITVRQFLQSNCDYLLMIDSDTIPEKNPLDLIELDKDVISCPTLQWNEGNVYWVVMERVHEGYRPISKEKRIGLQEVDAVGTACILIARRTLTDIDFPFRRRWTKEGVQDLGQDFNFCSRVRDLGFRVFAHWDYRCEHHKTLALRKVLNLTYQ